MSAASLAIVGGAPTFTTRIGARHPYFPSRKRFEAAFAGIFERQYYTNQGPLAAELEQRLSARLGVRHAIVVTSGTIGVMMAAEALSIHGSVVLPAAVPPAPAQALAWTGLLPIFCDVAPDTLQTSAALVADALDRSDADNVAAIMAINLWGGATDVEALATLAAGRGLPLFVDSAHGFGCTFRGGAPGRFGRAEIFSFGPGKIVTATEGGCVATDDDELAARLRNIRSSYGAGRPVAVVRTANGRMSEAQAAVALLSLDDYERNRDHNEALFGTYEKELNETSGIRVVRPAGVDASNYHYPIVIVDEPGFGIGARTLAAVLEAENVAVQALPAGLHRTLPWGTPDRAASDLPGTNIAAARCLRLPVGETVSAEAATQICEIVRRTHHAAPKIRALSRGP